MLDQSACGQESKHENALVDRTAAIVASKAAINVQEAVQSNIAHPL
jgi:hypothetical protein